MEISFTRSGGFAGRATNVSGLVRFDGLQAHVSSEGTDYGRDMTAEEASELRSLATAVPAKGGHASGAGDVRDGFQYDVLLHTEDGKQHSIRLGPHESSAGGASPATLSDWLDREAQRIWDHRLAQRPR